MACLQSQGGAFLPHSVPENQEGNRPSKSEPFEETRTQIKWHALDAFFCFFLCKDPPFFPCLEGKGSHIFVKLRRHTNNSNLIHHGLSEICIRLNFLFVCLFSIMCILINSIHHLQYKSPEVAETDKRIVHIHCLSFITKLQKHFMDFMTKCFKK